VRECCKDDDQSQRERPKFDPLPRLNPLTDGHQNLPTWLRRGSCKISSRSDKRFRFCACMRDFAHQIVYSAICLFFGGVLQIVYSQDARTDFDAKYVKRRRSAQGCAIWGSQNQTLSFTPLFVPKTAILGPLSTGLRNFRSKTPLTLDMYYINDAHRSSIKVTTFMELRWRLRVLYDISKQVNL